jgi:hypothetical protein
MNTRKETGHTKPMRTVITVLVTLLVITLAVLPGYSLPSEKKVNLTGTWVLNEQKSELGEYGRMLASEKIIIMQKGKNLRMDRSATAPTGESYSYVENYTLDGQECVNKMEPVWVKKSTVTWTDKKSSLTIISDMNVNFEGNEMNIKSVEIISLQDGGKSMVIKSTSSTDYGDLAITIVYDLQ